VYITYTVNSLYHYNRYTTMLEILVYQNCTNRITYSNNH